MSEEDEVTDIIESSNDEFKAKCIEEFKKIKGVGQAVAEKIYDAGYFSLMDIASAPVGDFIERTQISDKTAEKFITCARGLANIGTFSSAEELLESEIKPRLSTGSKELDNLIGGGYPTGMITEIHGENGVSKTQACLTASVLATQAISEGGLDGDVVFVDTEGTFKARRVKEIVEARGYDWATVSKRIHYMKATTTAHQMLIMDEIRKLNQITPIKLLVIDSVMSSFRAEFPGRGVLQARQMQLNTYLADLHRFAEANDAVVLVTNIVVADPGVLFGDPMKPAGGAVLGHACQYRIKVRKGKSERRIAKLIKAPDLPVGEAPYSITAKGVCDDKV